MLLLLDDRPSSDQIQSFQIQGDRTVAQIEHYKEASRKYPEPREVQLPEAPFGGWVYKLSIDGSFSLQLGDYGKDGFAISWSKEQEAWYLDS